MTTYRLEAKDKPRFKRTWGVYYGEWEPRWSLTWYNSTYIASTTKECWSMAIQHNCSLRYWLGIL